MLAYQFNTPYRRNMLLLEYFPHGHFSYKWLMLVTV